MKKTIIIVVFITSFLIYIIVNNMHIGSNTVENNIIKNNTAVKIPIEEKAQNILGTYTIKCDEPTIAFTFIFTVDMVIYKNDGYNEGTYSINNNKIYITYNKTLSPVDHTPMDFIRASETLIIENENTLVSENGTKFYRIKGE